MTVSQAVFYFREAETNICSSEFRGVYKMAI